MQPIGTTPRPPEWTWFSVDEIMNQDKQHFAATLYWPSQMALARALWFMDPLNPHAKADYAQLIAKGWPTRKGSARVDVDIMINGGDPLTEMIQRQLPNPPAFPDGFPWVPAMFGPLVTSADEPMPPGQIPVTLDPTAYPPADDLIVTENPLGSLALRSPAGNDGPGALWWPGAEDENGVLAFWLTGAGTWEKFKIVGAIGNTGAPIDLWIRLK